MNKHQRLAEVMANPEFADQVEVKVMRFRPHARRLFVSAVILIGISGAVPYFMNSFPEEWQNLALLIGAGLAVVLFVLMPFFSWLARTTTITTRRVIIRSGLVTQHRTEVTLGQVAELKLKRGLIQRMWGAGNIVLQSTFGSHVVLRNVPSVLVVSAALQELVHWQHSVQHGFGNGIRPGFAASR